jgi:hypothetical protein
MNRHERASTSRQEPFDDTIELARGLTSRRLSSVQSERFGGSRMGSLSAGGYEYDGSFRADEGFEVDGTMDLREENGKRDMTTAHAGGGSGAGAGAGKKAEVSSFRVDRFMGILTDATPFTERSKGYRLAILQAHVGSVEVQKMQARQGREGMLGHPQQFTVSQSGESTARHD